MDSSSALVTYVRHFAYMLVHDDDQHLWGNVVTQLVFASLATICKRRRKRWNGSIVGVQSEVASVYLLGGFAGACAFREVEATAGVRLVGASAGALALAGLCLSDAIIDLICLAGARWREGRWPPEATRTVMLVVGRLCCAGYTLAHDVAASLVNTDEATRVVFLVHLAGFGAGAMLAFASHLCLCLRKTVDCSHTSPPANKTFFESVKDAADEGRRLFVEGQA